VYIEGLGNGISSLYYKIFPTCFKGALKYKNFLLKVSIDKAKIEQTTLKITAVTNYEFIRKP
jgi:hypothetical protein